jgi:transcriptional regulator with XRE-family HTH domain
MATTLAPVDSREVVRCDHCHMVQFRTISGLCRRCHTSLDEEVPPPVEAVSTPASTLSNCEPGLQVASAIRVLRQRNGISQRQLALRMGVPRTYVSKIENEKATPTLSSLERLAAALQVTVPDLLAGGRSESISVRELLADEFIAELVPYMPKLSPLQWQSVLAQVRDMTLHTRRGA